MGGVIGLNILGQFVADQATLISFAKQLNPAAFLVMDAPGLYASLRQALPNALAIARTYHPKDAEPHLNWSPDQWLNQYGATAPGGYVQAGNEPNGYADAAAQAAWYVTLMQKAKARNIRLGVTAYGVGHPDENAIAGGVYDAMIRELASGYHLLILHEYAKDSTVNERPHHIGRFQRWIDRAKLLGVNAPRIVIGEYGRDNVGPGTGGGVHDGWRGVGWSETQYADFLRGAAPLYASAGIPTCVFCYGSGAGGGWQSFNIEGAGTLQERLVQMNVQYPVVQAVTTHPKPDNAGTGEIGRVRANLVSNVRRAHTTQGNTPLGTIRSGDSVTWYPAVDVLTDGTPYTAGMPIPSGAYRWTWIEYGSLVGWVALVSESWAVQFENPEQDETVIALLDVPFVSQLDANADRRGNDCGIACALMVDRYLEVRAGRGVPSIPVVDDLIQYVTELAGQDTPVHLNSLVTLLGRRGIHAAVRRPFAVTDIQAEISAGRPVVMLCVYKHIVPEDVFNGGHYVTCVGFSDKSMIVHDPYRGGAGYRVPLDRFALAISDLGNVGMSNQGIVLIP